MKRAHGLDIPQTLEEVCDPKRMVLVVYDMKIGILTQIKNANAIVAKVSQVLEAARAAGVWIFFMRHMSLPKELMGTFVYRMAMAWQRTHDPEKVTPRFLRQSRCNGRRILAPGQPAVAAFDDSEQGDRTRRATAASRAGTLFRAVPRFGHRSAGLGISRRPLEAVSEATLRPVNDFVRSLALVRPVLRGT